MRLRAFLGYGNGLCFDVANVWCGLIRTICSRGSCRYPAGRVPGRRGTGGWRCGCWGERHYSFIFSVLLRLDLLAYRLGRMPGGRYWAHQLYSSWRACSSAGWRRACSSWAWMMAGQQCSMAGWSESPTWSRRGHRGCCPGLVGRRSGGRGFGLGRDPRWLRILISTIDVQGGKFEGGKFGGYVKSARSGTGGDGLKLRLSRRAAPLFSRRRRWAAKWGMSARLLGDVW